MDSCKLISSNAYNRIYNYQVLGDTLLELHHRNTKGEIFNVLYYRKISKTLDLSFKNNPNIFTNGNNFLFKNINVFARKHFDYNRQEYGNIFYQISKDKDNLYVIQGKSGFHNVIKRYDNILFFIVGDKIYCEAFDRIELYNHTPPYQSDFEVCTLEDARAEIQRIIKKRRVLIKN